MDKKIALVTGASGGIGGAFARLLDEKGYSLYMPVRNLHSKDVLQLQKDIPHAHIAQCDVGDEYGTYAYIEQLSKENIVPSIVFLGAGTFEWDDVFPGTTPEEREHNAIIALTAANLLTKQTVVESLRRFLSDHLKEIEVHFMCSHAADFDPDHEFRKGMKEEGYVHAMKGVAEYAYELQGLFKKQYVWKPGLIDTPMAREKFTVARIGPVDWTTIKKPEQYVREDIFSMTSY